jgi:dienelactone hydrolase
LTLTLFFLFPPLLHGQSKVPPWDLWTDQVISEIRDRSTLELSVSLQIDHADVFFTSNPAASWFEEIPPYAEHRNEKIRIHGILVYPPPLVGPRPALVIGHGHGGHADLLAAQAVAALGYVAFYIDGPQAGLSTGGPKDNDQAWISVDKGPQYGFLYHYSYAGMRALTALEELAAQPGNPYRIDATRFGVLGASMGGIFTSHINAVDDRVKAAIIMASAGNWQHTLRYPNAWLWFGIYAGTRDLPYNGSDPLNSIEDIDWDPTAITFMNYFDPIRYATRQHAPVLTLMGTHDQYFPLPNANLMQQAITSAGTQDNFEKRLWLIPNKPHTFADGVTDLVELLPGLSGWLDYCFGKRDKPLATPQVAMTDIGLGLRFQISLAESSTRLSGAVAVLYAATRIDSTVVPLNDFKSYLALPVGDHFETLIFAGDKPAGGDPFRADNVIFYATVTDTLGLGVSVSSLVYRGNIPMDLSTDFVPTIDPYHGVIVPPPPPLHDAAVSVTSSLPAASDGAYQGMALTNPTDQPLAVRVEARTAEGRIAAGEGLINPIFISLPPRAQQVFVANEWFGPGVQNFNGSFRAGWSNTRATSLSFRGSVAPSELDGIGPVAAPATDLWLPLAPGQDPAAARKIRIFGGAAAAGVQIIYRASNGNPITAAQASVPAGGTLDVTPPTFIYSGPVSVEIQASNPVSARLETSGARDTWSIDARPVPAATRYVQPHTEWYGTYTTWLLVTNPSNQTRRLNPEVRLPDGSPVLSSSVTQTLGPLMSIYLNVEAAVGMAPGHSAGAGWLNLDSPDGPLIVTALAMDSKRGAVAASAIDTPTGGAWSMPFYVESAGYWTGLAIANPGDSPAQITITAYDKDGNQLASANVTLEARQSRAQLVYQWLAGLPAGTTGQIVVTSSAPVQLVAYFGTDDNASLAAIPLQTIAP